MIILNKMKNNFQDTRLLEMKTAIANLRRAVTVRFRLMIIKKKRVILRMTQKTLMMMIILLLETRKNCQENKSSRT